MSLKKSLTLLILLGLMSGLYAGERPIVKVADWYFKQFDYLKAIDMYKRALVKDKDKKDVHVLQKLADSYRLINDWANAETYYGQLVQIENTDVIDKLYYAEALRANQKYADAKVYYKEYADLAPTDNSVKERLTRYRQG